MLLPDDDELYEVNQTYLGPPRPYVAPMRHMAFFAWLRHRPLCVWPEPDPEVHSGRLILWVGDSSMAKQKTSRGRSNGPERSTSSSRSPSA